jgi:hypothetical protein
MTPAISNSSPFTASNLGRSFTKLNLSGQYFLKMVECYGLRRIFIGCVPFPGSWESARAPGDPSRPTTAIICHLFHPLSQRSHFMANLVLSD